jgi:hypothetical protein
MQSVPITTSVVSSNPAQARCTQYNIYVIKIVSGIVLINVLNTVGKLCELSDITCITELLSNFWLMSGFICRVIFPWNVVSARLNYLIVENTLLLR